MKHLDEQAESCEYIHVHEGIVDKVNEQMPEEDKLYDLADFQSIADSTNQDFVCICVRRCVCDLAQILNMTQSAISHQLRTLKQMDLVRNRREGKTVFYALADSHIKTILSQGMDHIEEDD